MAYCVIPAYLGKMLRLKYPESVVILQRASHPRKHPSRRDRISPHEVNSVLYEMGLQVPYTPLRNKRRSILWIPTAEAEGLYEAENHSRVAWDVDKTPALINDYLVKKENSND